MTRDVLVSISGLQVDVLEENGRDNDAIEIITPASYFCKNGKHYIVYDEFMEGTQEITKNRIKITGDDTLEIVKSGLTNTHMTFQKNKKNQTYYQMPFGQMLIGINTKSMEVDVEEKNINVKVDYVLDVNHEPLADCKIRMNIKAKDAGDFVLS